LAAAAAVVLRWLAENGRLRDELGEIREDLHSARTRLDGIAALSVGDRPAPDRPPTQPPDPRR
jgi:hypothetical protein